MARQDTTCIQPDEVTSWQSNIAGGAVTAAAVAAALAAALGAGVPLAAAVGVIVAAFGGLAGYCNWYFNGRLVCIADDQSAVAKVHLTEMNFDGDFTLNTLLAPTPPGSTLAELQAGPQGAFMVNQHPALPFFPEKAGDPWNGTPIFHIEIEGSRMKSLCAGGTVGGIIGAAAGIAIAVACAAGAATIILLILCLLVALIVALIGLAAGAGIGYLAGSDASPVDAGETREISPDDCVAFRGRWIYDSGHEGWNEIHAVMRIMKLAEDCLKLDAQRIQVILAQLNQADNPDIRKKQLSQGDNRFLIHRSIG